MPKFQTFPTLFDEILSIDISTLRKAGLLMPKKCSRSQITWANKECISVIINMNSLNPYANLEYDYKGEALSYEVKLVTIPSNLGKGLIWCFLCPFTLKRCKKLHFIKGQFKHRSALPNGMYRKQTHSKKWRQIEAIYGYHFDLDEFYKELHSKHFKTHYNGMPTKRYLKLAEKIVEGESIPYEEIELLMIS